MGAGLAANLVLIGPLGFSIAATAQFVLVAAAFGSRRFFRDLVIALVLTLAVWFGFVEVLGVNIGAGVLEGLVLRALGQEMP
jgi:putative tricarboxylic transport membrane protein